MKHAILGAGGVGGFLAGALARAGFPVTLLVRADTLDRYPRQLTIQSAVLGDFGVEVDVASSPRSPLDVLWIAVKATQLGDALTTAPAGAMGEALVIPLLNGVGHMSFLREVYGSEHVVAATIRVESERAGPGMIRQLSPFAEVRFAPPTLLRSRTLDVARDVGVAGLGGEVEVDETTLLWRKLVFLAPVALTTTASGRPLGGVREDPVWRARLEGCLDEVFAIAEAEGAHVDLEAVLQMLLSGPYELKSSMQKDVEAGRQPEIDAIGGDLVRLGRVHGIGTPMISELVEMIEAKAAIAEAGDRKNPGM